MNLTALQDLDEVVGNSLARVDEIDVVFFVAGSLLLVFGRRLYWLALAALGFVVAMRFANEHLLFDDPQARLIGSLAIGFAGGLLAIFAQKLAVAVAGFVLGGWGTLVLVQALWPDLGGLLTLCIAAVGAVLGLAFAAKLFAVALILVTSAVGALLIAGHLHLPPAYQGVVWMVLTLLGLVAQVGRSRKKAKLED